MTEDTNAEIWKSDAVVAEWARTAATRERARLEHWRTLARLLPYGEEDAFCVLDLGAGTGSAARVVLDAYPNATAVLAEYSPQMIAEGHKALQPYAGRFAYVEFDMLTGVWPEGIPGDLDAAITSLCVHHLPDERKRGLFAELLAHLRPGGWYLNYDPVVASDPLVEEAWLAVSDREDPAAAHQRAHRTPEEQARYENHVRYMIPLEPQVAWLREAGFEAVDVYWKYLDNVIYGGRRPSSRP